jgi:hypothetical protein
MRGGVIGGGNPVPSAPDNLAAAHNNGPERPSFIGFHLFDGKANGFTEKGRIEVFRHRCYLPSGSPRRIVLVSLAAALVWIEAADALHERA